LRAAATADELSADGEVGDVLDLTPALERDRLGEDLVEVLVVEQLAGERHGVSLVRGDPSLTSR